MRAREYVGDMLRLHGGSDDCFRGTCCWMMAYATVKIDPELTWVVRCDHELVAADLSPNSTLRIDFWAAACLCKGQVMWTGPLPAVFPSVSINHDRFRWARPSIGALEKTTSDVFVGSSCDIEIYCMRASASAQISKLLSIAGTTTPTPNKLDGAHLCAGRKLSGSLVHPPPAFSRRSSATDQHVRRLLGDLRVRSPSAASTGLPDADREVVAG